MDKRVFHQCKAFDINIQKKPLLTANGVIHFINGITAGDELVYETLEINGEMTTYEEMLVFACSCTSSPLGLTVNILFKETPTCLYE